jgi:acetoin utilization protein AcuB
MHVRDCPMVSPVVLSSEASLSVAERLLGLHDITHAAVVDRGRIVGVVSTRMIGAAHPSIATSLTRGEIHGRLDQLEVADVMARDPLIVSPATPLAEAVRLMKDARLDALAVCDQERLVGLLTARDLLRALERLTAPGSA